MVTFDSALGELVRVCRSAAVAGAIARWCVVRDLRGRLRLVLKPKEGTDPDLRELAASLETSLGNYFVAPIWSTATAGDEGRLAAAALGASEQWAPTYEDHSTGKTLEVSDESWRKLERRLSKESWLENTPGPPWRLSEGPGIVTFYSFKGGVGRTTALVATAWQLASAEKKRVAVVDLDLEAPGLGAVLDADAPRGVLDFVVEFLATGERSLGGMHSAARGLGADDAGLVDVIPAGHLDSAYLEKLSRLDFMGNRPLERSTAAPVVEALQSLLHAVRKELKPDYILIDAGAGLHDLAGLSLHGLAHVDVLLARASEQSYRGLDLAIEVIGRRRPSSDLLCVVVHTLAPPDSTSAVAREEEGAFLRRSYASFCDHVYEENEAPQQEATDQPHWPRVIRQDVALERYTSISGIRGAFFSSGFVELRRRIVELCEPEDLGE